MSLKDITDAEKPWFDYISYLLKLGAWTLAIVYASHQQLRPRPPGMGFPIFEWGGIILAGCFGAFLIYRFIVMSARLAGEIAKGLEEGLLRRRVVYPLIMIWLLFGMPAFSASVTAETVELYLEKYYPERIQANTVPVEPRSQIPTALAGPWERSRPVIDCRSKTVIAGTTTLCPIIPIEW